MDVKFISQDNEVQKLYAKFGMVVPVGDLSTGKAPAIQPLPSTSTQTSVTAQFNVMSGADISALSYTVNDGEAVSITPAKGVVTITLTDLEYNSGPYEIEITAVNENGSTSASVDTDLVHYTNWATPDEVLAGNKFIGEDGQEHTGEYECPTCPEPVLETVPVTPTTSAQTITPSTGYDGIGTVNVSAVTSAIDANIQAGNIKKDVEILGVTGTFEGGPTDGGAVATGKSYMKSDMGMEFPALDITFSTLPTGFDTANHTYYMFVAAHYFAEGSDPENQSIMKPLIDGNSYLMSTQYNYDSTTQTYTIDFYDLDFTHYGPSIATIVYIFEDDLLHLKWIVPCTFVEQTV